MSQLIISVWCVFYMNKYKQTEDWIFTRLILKYLHVLKYIIFIYAFKIYKHTQKIEVDKKKDSGSKGNE